MSIPKRNNLILPGIVTIVLWLLTGVLGLVTIYAVLQLALLVFALLTSQDRDAIGRYFAGVFTGQITALLAGGFWLVAMIWSGEYSMKHLGERRLWKVYAWMIGIEIILISIAWFLNLF